MFRVRRQLGVGCRETGASKQSPPGTGKKCRSTAVSDRLWLDYIVVCKHGSKKDWGRGRGGGGSTVYGCLFATLSHLVKDNATGSPFLVVGQLITQTLNPIWWPRAWVNPTWVGRSSMPFPQSHAPHTSHQNICVYSLDDNAGTKAPIKDATRAEAIRITSLVVLR